MARIRASVSDDMFSVLLGIPVPLDVPYGLLDTEKMLHQARVELVFNCKNKR